MYKEIWQLNFCFVSRSFALGEVIFRPSVFDAMLYSTHICTHLHIHHLMWCIYHAWWIDDHLLEHQVTRSTRIQHVQWISQASWPNAYNHPETLFSAQHRCTFLLPLLIVLVVLYHQGKPHLLICGNKFRSALVSRGQADFDQPTGISSSQW